MQVPYNWYTLLSLTRKCVRHWNSDSNLSCSTGPLTTPSTISSSKAATLSTHRQQLSCFNLHLDNLCPSLCLQQWQRRREPSLDDNRGGHANAGARVRLALTHSRRGTRQLLHFLPPFPFFIFTLSHSLSLFSFLFNFIMVLTRSGRQVLCE